MKLIVGSLCSVLVLWFCFPASATTGPLPIASFTPSAAINVACGAVAGRVGAVQPAGSGSQPTFVQGGANNGGNVNSISAAFPSSVGTGHLLVAAVGYAGNNIDSVALTVTDSLGNSWVSAVGPVRRDTHGVAQIFYVKSSLGGADTVTVTSNSGNAYLELYVHEYNGTDTSAPLDVTASGQGSSTTPSTSAVTTTAANEVIFGYAGLTNPGAAGSGFTARETLGGDVSEDELVTATGSYSATFSQPSTGQWIALMATFKASSGTRSVCIFSDFEPLDVGGRKSFARDRDLERASALGRRYRDPEQ